MHLAKQWSNIGTQDSNEAVVVSLVRPSPTGLVTLGSFHPTFTYPIFGEQEIIYGYKNLKIGLLYNASDMRPNLQVTYSRKLKNASLETETTDVTAQMEEVLPPGM